MNILLLGSGGREHALAWKMNQSPLCNQLFIAPGNAGTAQCGTNVSLALNFFISFGNFVTPHQIILVFFVPENPLVAGIVNFLNSDSQLKIIIIIAPVRDGAQLKGRKIFS